MKQKKYYYYEDGEETLLTENEIRQYYDNYYSEDEKKMGTDYQCFLYDSIKMGLLVPADKENSHEIEEIQH